MAGHFDLSRYPIEFRLDFFLGAMYWMQVVQKAKAMGYDRLDMLTDFVFHMHHPELHGRPINAGETGLANEWNGFRAVIKPTIDFTPRGPSSHDRYKLLADADLKALGGSTEQLARRSSLRAFLCRAHAGEKVDDGYWTYEYYTAVVGSEAHHPAESSGRAGPIGLIRKKHKHAIQEFEEGVRSASTSAQVASVLGKLESEVYHNTNVVLWWAKERVSDMASIKDAKEWLYLTELYLHVAFRDDSVYFVYAREILVMYRSATKPPSLSDPRSVIPVIPE